MDVLKNFKPKRLKELCVTTFLVFIVPIVYYFELFIVLPCFFEQWGYLHLAHILVGTFVLFNIISNYVQVVSINTSIKGLILPVEPLPEWHFCSVCECVVPPRSWHCTTCNVCILKRDHHCLFTSCCIGHRNLRYFLMFVFYMFISTLYVSIYNGIYALWIIDFVWNWNALVKIVFPLAMIFVRYSFEQLLIFLILIVAIGSVFTGVLLHYHINQILKGLITHEQRTSNVSYDYGRTTNLENCLGTRWKLIWISPFIRSTLTHDGIHWLPAETTKNK